MNSDELNENNYIAVPTRDWKFYLLPALAEAPFADLCSLPRSDLPIGVYPVVSSENTEVRRFVYEGKGYFLKEYFFINWKKHFKVLRRGQRLIYIARIMNKHGFLTPDIVGIGSCGRNRRVVTEAVENARDIWDVLFPENNKYRGYVDDGFVYELGRTIGEFHKRGFFHGDLRWRNVLTRNDEDGWKFYFIDNDRTTRFRFGIPFRCRVKNLCQIFFSGLLLKWPEEDWETFLHGYFGGSTLSEKARKKIIKRVELRAYKRFEDRNCCETEK